MFKRLLPGIGLILLLPGFPEAELSNLYPTSPVVTIRLSAYQDALNTIAKSTDTFTTDAWESLGSTFTWVNGSQTVQVSKYEWDGSTWAVNGATLSVQDYSRLVWEEGRLRGINEVLDRDMEQYFVFPTTSPPVGWLGWCGQTINGKLVAVVCP